MATRKVPREKNVDLKSLQVNVLESVTRITKTVAGLPAD